jgi:hypothetical protein
MRPGIDMMITWKIIQLPNPNNNSRVWQYCKAHSFLQVTYIQRFAVADCRYLKFVEMFLCVLVRYKKCIKASIRISNDGNKTKWA